MNDWVKNWIENEESLKKEPIFNKKEMKGFLFSEQLRLLGIKCGVDVMIHERCLIFYPHNIEVGNNVRIDADTKLCPGQDGFIKIGSNVHISFNVALMAGAGIILGDFTNIAMNSSLFSVSDDFTGKGLIGPMVPEKTRSLHKGTIIMKDHAVVGVSSTLLPGTILSEGTALHGYSVIKGITQPFSEYKGIPAVLFRERSREMLKHVKEIK